MARKKRKILFVLLIILLCLLLVASVGVFVFTVKETVVEGNEHYTVEQVEELVLDDKYSWNSLYVYFKYLFFEQKEIPFIDTMEVTLLSPFKIKIEVYEKGIVGYFYFENVGKNMYFDKDGIVVESLAEKLEGVPEIAGLDFTQAVLHEKLPTKNTKLFKTILTLTQSLDNYGIVPDKINFNKEDQMILYFGNVTVLLGEDYNTVEKIIRLQYLLPQLVDLTGTLHMEEWTEDEEDIRFVRE